MTNPVIPSNPPGIPTRETQEPEPVSDKVTNGPMCPFCHKPRGFGLFCDSCSRSNRNPNNPIIVATRLRRFGGYILESTIFILTLGIGWLIWLAIVSPKSQTPAKSLLDMYITDENGTPATTKKVWIREILVKVLLIGITATVFGGIIHLANAIWIFFDRDHQTIHDKIVGTVVVYTPNGLNYSQSFNTTTSNPLQTEIDALDIALTKGKITIHEYENCRKKLRE